MLPLECLTWHLPFAQISSPWWPQEVPSITFSDSSTGCSFPTGEQNKAHGFSTCRMDKKRWGKSYSISTFRLRFIFQNGYWVTEKIIHCWIIFIIHIIWITYEKVFLYEVNEITGGKLRAQCKLASFLRNMATIFKMFQLLLSRAKPLPQTNQSLYLKKYFTYPYFWSSFMERLSLYLKYIHRTLHICKLRLIFTLWIHP